MSKNKTVLPDTDIEKQIYLSNRAAMLEEFRSALASKSEFAIRAAIMVILQQEEYIKHIATNYRKFANSKDEDKVLQALVKEAENVYGKDYSKYYSDIKKQRSDDGKD